MSTTSLRRETKWGNAFETETPTRDSFIRKTKKIRLIFIVTAALVAVLMILHQVLLQTHVFSLSQSQATLEERMRSETTAAPLKLITDIARPPVPPWPRGLPGRLASILRSNYSSQSLNLSEAAFNQLEQLRTMLQMVEAKVDYFLPPVDKLSCGGYLHIKTPQEVSYEALPSPTLHGCAWVIVAETDGPLELRLMPDPKLQTNPNFTLRALYKHNETSCMHTDITTPGLAYNLKVQFIVLFYYGQTHLGGQGFRLNIRDVGMDYTWDSHINPSFHVKNDTFSLRHQRCCASDEAFFILGAPPEGKRINVTVSGINTEANRDGVTLFWIDPSVKPSPHFCESLAGTAPIDIVVALPENMPFVLFFWSDSFGRIGPAGGFYLSSTFY